MMLPQICKRRTLAFVMFMELISPGFYLGKLVYFMRTETMHDFMLDDYYWTRKLKLVSTPKD